MKNQDILKLLKDIFSKEKIKDYTLVLDKKLHIGNSYLKNYYDTNREMHIGVKELKDVFNRDVSDKLLVKAVISIYHEIRHYYQQLDFFEKYKCINDERIKEFFYNYLACLGSSNGFYLTSYNYYNNPREIEAEYIGVIKAYNYLCIIYPEKEVENLIVNYINDKIDYQYFIHIDNPVSSIQEIDIIFKNTINNCRQKKRIYDVNCINEDKSIKYIQSINDDFVLQVNDINNGILQDELIAGAYVKYIKDKNIKTELNKTQIYKDNSNELLDNLETVIEEDKIISKNDYELD